MESRLSEAYAAEIALALEARERGDHEECFVHLERAHVLGQRSTLRHVYAHWLMLAAGMAQRDFREVAGQIPRMFAAALSSRVWVPLGNTGRARVNAFTPMALPPDLRDLLS
jgi:uncharacterized protein DUF3703